MRYSNVSKRLPKCASSNLCGAGSRTHPNSWKSPYADLLLLQNRDRDVLELLKGKASHDTLLLRMAIAARRLGTGDAERWARLYDARRLAERQEDARHLREHARFMLDVRGVPDESLALARHNWRTQREAADVRIFLRAAQAAQSADAEAAVRGWIAETGYEDRVLENLRSSPGTRR